MPHSLGMAVGDDHVAAASDERGPGELSPGTLLGGYRIETVAGRGGMGVVYRATQLSLGRTVALKVIAPVLAADPVFRRRFADESALAASLDHPNVITIYEAGEDGGRLYVSMRFVPGTDLGKLLAADGPLDPTRAVGLIAGVADALDAAHAHGLVHRDVKPSNVLVERRGGGELAFLSDFGVVKRIGADAEKTGSAGWVGSANFVAPEQVLGGPVDARSDIYALGGVLYTALTGQVPFDRPDIAGKLYASVNERVPSVRQSRPELPAGLDGVIARATAKDPAARYASAGEFAAAARAALATATPASSIPLSASAGSPVTSAPLATDRNRGRRWRRPVMVGAAGLALAILIVVVVVVASSGGGQHQPSHRAVAHRASPKPGSVPKAAARTSTVTVASRGIVTVDGVGQTSVLQHYRLTIYDLRRVGPYVVLDFGIVCHDPYPGPGCSSSDWGMQGESSEVLTNLNLPAGITLIDPADNKEYAVVTDSHLHAQASALPLDGILDDSLHLAWVKFPAPPATTHAMDVVIPDGGPQIPLVPISDTAAPLPTNLGPKGTGNTPGAHPPDTFMGTSHAQPVNSTSTAGMTLPVSNLITTVGNPSGSDAESPSKATITIRSDVLFRFAKSSLTARARTILGQVAQKIKSRATGPVQVTGYTDSIGPDQVNVPLSRARAAAVVNELRPQTSGVAFKATGLGSADPVAPNTKQDGSDNPAGRALNRRVTISFPVHASAPAAPPASSSPATAPAGSAARTVSYQVPSDNQNSWRVTINGIYRDGDLAVMRLGITCTLEVGKDCNGAQDFIGTQNVPPLSNSQDWLANSPSSFWTLGGFYLIDPTTGNEYIPVYLAASDPLTSPINNTMNAGVTFPLWIYFPAPSASTVTVSLPGGSPRIANVPVSAAAGTQP